MTIVGLFVNADPKQVNETLANVPIHLLQFHGDEDESYCRQFARPYMKAARVKPGLDLVQYAAGFPSAQAILLDAYAEGYGGSGQVFDWTLIPPRWISRSFFPVAWMREMSAKQLTRATGSGRCFVGG